MSKAAKDSEIMLEIADKVIENALAAGSDQAKVVGTVDETLKITCENREFTMANSLSAEAFGLGVHKNQRKGSAVVNSTDIDDLNGAIKEALELAKYSLEDSFLIMPDKAEASKPEALNFLYDQKMSDVTPKEIEEIMSHCLGEFLQDKRVAVERFEISIGSSVHTMRNSKGVVQSEIQTGAGWSIMGMARDGDQVSGMDYLGGHSFSWDKVAELAAKDCKDFSETVIGSLNPVHSPSYKGVVVLSPRALRPLIISTILFHASGSAVMDGKSKWSKKIGEQIASKKLSLHDNPHSPLLAGASSYDSDGLPTSAKEIVTEGKLMDHLHSCYTANRTATKSNAQSGGPFGLTLESGDQKLAELLKLQKETLLVNRFSGNVDPLTGDFSGVAKSSHLYKDGVNAGAVKEVMIAGNVFEMMNQIIGFSSESMNVSNSFVAPWVAADGITVS